jgi:prepilin-type N-terminal cleavage/methylation domain-containing protein
MVKSRDRGFTLIEMAVVLAIMAFLALVASPFTVGWSNAARVRQSTHRLVEGAAHAKSFALRNAGAVTGDQPAAVLVAAGSRMCVYSGVPDALSCDGATVWSAQSTAHVELNGQAGQCVALNNLAMPVDATIGSVTCGSGSYVVSLGGERYPSNGSHALD